MPDYKEHYAELERPTAMYVATRGSTEIARSSSVILLKEHYRGKAMAPVPYFPAESVQVERAKTERSTRCPIKGGASYWTLSGVENAAWSYEDPVDGVGEIKGYLAFDQNKGFAVRIEGT